MTMAEVATTENAGLPVRGAGRAVGADEPTVELPTWPLRERLAWVRRFRRAVVAKQDELIALAGEEVRKDAFETLVSDLVPLLSSCRWHERHAGRVLRTRRLRGGSVWQIGQRHWLGREPLGLVGIIATWNYPVQLLGIQLVQAIVAGNAVVVKPSERCPKTQRRLLEIAQQAGLPGGALRVRSASREAGAAMLQGEPLDHLVFTGSTPVGRSIAQTLAPWLVPSTLELSGRDSALVLGDADVELAARSIGAAVRLNAGQTCMAPRRVLVDATLADRFAGLLRAEVAKGGPLTACDGAPCEAEVVVCEASADLVEGDHFAPRIAVVACASVERMIEVHREIGQHLATSVFTTDTTRARSLVGQLAAGTVTINDAVIPTAHPGAPLPALGASGWGVSRGELGLLAMTRPVHVSSTSRRVRVPTDPPTGKQAEQVKKFVRFWYGR
ncbi:MAG: aldehyde dehydrogenase family protein [Phycisphaerales bacterium]